MRVMILQSMVVICLSCQIPYHQCLPSLNAWTPLSEKAVFFTEFCFITPPSQSWFPRIMFVPIGATYSRTSVECRFLFLPFLPHTEKNEQKMARFFVNPCFSLGESQVARNSGVIFRLTYHCSRNDYRINSF